MINELKVERKVLLQENYALKRRLEAVCNGDMWNEVYGIMKELRQLKETTTKGRTEKINAELARANKQLKIAYVGMFVLSLLFIVMCIL